MHVSREAIRDPFSLPRHLWTAGVASVSGQRCVAEALKREGPFSLHDFLNENHSQLSRRTAVQERKGVG